MKGALAFKEYNYSQTPSAMAISHTAPALVRSCSVHMELVQMFQARAGGLVPLKAEQ